MDNWKKKKVLGTGGLITSRPAHFSLLPSEWHYDLSSYQASTMASIMTFNKHFLSINKGQWFQGWESNSVKVMDTCGQQSSADGIGVTFIHINSNIKPFFLYLYLNIKWKYESLTFHFEPIIHEYHNKSIILVWIGNKRICTYVYLKLSLLLIFESLQNDFIDIYDLSHALISVISIIWLNVS